MATNLHGYIGSEYMHVKKNGILEIQRFRKSHCEHKNVKEDVTKYCGEGQGIRSKLFMNIYICYR